MLVIFYIYLVAICSFILWQCSKMLKKRLMQRDFGMDGNKFHVEKSDDNYCSF